MEFTGNVTSCVTSHSALDDRDCTVVRLDNMHSKNPDHRMNKSCVEISGPAKEMQKFIDAHKCHKKQEFAKVRITIDLDEPEGQDQTSQPLVPISPLTQYIDLVFAAL